MAKSKKKMLRLTLKTDKKEDEFKTFFIIEIRHFKVLQFYPSFRFILRLYCGFLIEFVQTLKYLNCLIINNVYNTVVYMTYTSIHCNV